MQWSRWNWKLNEIHLCEKPCEFCCVLLSIYFLHFISLFDSIYPHESVPFVPSLKLLSAGRVKFHWKFSWKSLTWNRFEPFHLFVNNYRVTIAVEYLKTSIRETEMRFNGTGYFNRLVCGTGHVIVLQDIIWGQFSRNIIMGSVIPWKRPPLRVAPVLIRSWIGIISAAPVWLLPGTVGRSMINIFESQFIFNKQICANAQSVLNEVLEWLVIQFAPHGGGYVNRQFDVSR